MSLVLQRASMWNFGFAFLCGGGGAQVWSLRDGQNRGENVRGGVEEALNQADPTRSCERGGKLAAGLIILISFTLWITVELESRGELPEIDELFSPGPGKMHPRAFTPWN